MTTNPIQANGEETLTIRRARPDDELRLIRLAGRDTRPRPRGELLVAEEEGELLVARSIGTGETIADPFRHTAAIAELVAARAEALARAGDAVERTEARGRGWFGLRRRSPLAA